MKHSGDRQGWARDRHAKYTFTAHTRTDTRAKPNMLALNVQAAASSTYSSSADKIVLSARTPLNTQENPEYL